MKRLLLSIACLLMLTGSIWAQERAVSGKISDASGEALPGVTVLVKGTTTGTQSNFEGEFKLNVPVDGTHLIFSFVGMASQEVEIGSQTEFAITMAEDTQQLTEIVVTAQGIVKTRNELTYAAQQVGGEEVSKNRSANFVNNLSGKVSGVNIARTNTLGGSTNVLIRGVASLNGNNQALFIVDGVPLDNTTTRSSNQATGSGGYDYGSAISDLNPDDIASVNVLKGAAATVLYGSRASNGVVLITTKQGKSKKGIGVTLNIGASATTIDKSTFTKYQDQYGAGYWPYYEDPSGYFLYRDIDGDGNPDLVAPTSEDASVGAKFDPSLMVYQWDAFDASSPNFGKPRPWVAAANGPSSFFETGKNANISIALDKQTESGYYKFSYSKSNQTGVIPGNGLNKDYVNFGSSHKITPKLTIASSINFTRRQDINVARTGYNDNIMTNFREWWQTNVDVQEQKAAYERTKSNVTWNWADPTNLKPIYWDNPYYRRANNTANAERNRFYGYSSLNYKVADWLTLSGRVSMDSYRDIRTEQVSVTSNAVSSYLKRNGQYSEFNYNFIANFNKKLNEDMSVRGLLGTNTRMTTVENTTAVTNGGLILPNNYSIRNSKDNLSADYLGDNYSQLKVVGVFANASFAYKKMLFVEASLRNDTWSSLPAKNNSFFYPALSTSFSFTDLIGSSDIFTAGKIRASIAETGQGAQTHQLVDILTNTSAYSSTYVDENGETISFTAPKYSVNGKKFNNNLKEERTRSTELGLELSFLDGRVGFDVTYYNQTTRDQILPVAISRATGYNSKVLNAAKSENKGVEMMLFATPIKTDDFSWKLTFNFTRNRNKVISLAEGLDNLLLNPFVFGATSNAVPGQPFGVLRGTDYVYDDNGNKIIGASGRPLKTSNANNVLGNTNPDWIGGVSNTLRYKGLALSFLIDVKHGGVLFNQDMYFGLETGLLPETVGDNGSGGSIREDGIVFDGVQADGSVNTVAASPYNFALLGYRGQPDAAFIYDASFVKLREVTITYSLPTSVMEKLKFARGIDISLVGSNLWLISGHVPYADPESNLGAGVRNRGYQVGTYPMNRNMGFNLKFRF